MIFCRGENLKLKYPGRKAPLGPMNFTCLAGGITVLLGKNGAGKSSLLKAILGEVAISEGSLVLWEKPAESIVEKVAYVPQESFFSESLKVFDILALAYLPSLGFFGKLSKAQRNAIAAMQAAFGIEPLGSREMIRLSTGEKQRVLLARALLQNPRLVLLDEPTNHLDPEGRHQFWEVLERLRTERGFEVLLSTHDLSLARRKAHYVCALRDGIVTYHGDASPFWNGEFKAEIFGTVPIY